MFCPRLKQLSTTISGKAETFIISKAKLNETFPIAQYCIFYKVFAILIGLIVILTVVVFCLALERIYPHD